MIIILHYAHHTMCDNFWLNFLELSLRPSHQPILVAAFRHWSAESIHFVYVSNIVGFKVLYKHTKHKDHWQYNGEGDLTQFTNSQSTAARGGAADFKVGSTKQNKNYFVPPTFPNVGGTSKQISVGACWIYWNLLSGCRINKHRQA